MVYTRQMTIGNNGCNEVSETTCNENGPARSTRNCTSLVSYQGHCSKRNPCNSPSKGVHFLDLPQEIIEKIFGYLKYKNVCQLRFVCTRIDRICGSLLNSTFQRLQHQLLERFTNLKSKMPRRESVRRKHHLACEYDIIETLHMHLTLLQMSLGKHIERRHCCFFPGEILDEVLHILHYIKVTPMLPRPYNNVTDELFELSSMAMEYFKEKIEPDLPEIPYFSRDFLEFSGTFPSVAANRYSCLDTFSSDMEEATDSDTQVSEVAANPETVPEPAPQSSNVVLRKGIRKIKQGMKKYNSQLSILRQDVRSCRQKAAEQQKLMSEQQKQFGEQQKQILEYATRMEENEKKNEEISRKFSTLLQELNKCKTELQYWRSKSPATPPFCSRFGNVALPHPDEPQASLDQAFDLKGLKFDPSFEIFDVPAVSNESQKPPLDSSIASALKKDEIATKIENSQLTTVCNKKRKFDEAVEVATKTSTGSSTKKSRRVSKGLSNKRSKV